MLRREPPPTHRPSLTATAPAVVYLDVTDRCNLTCPMCPRTLWDEQGAPVRGFLPMDRVASLGSLFARAGRVICTGIGEPLLHPRLREMLRVIKSHGPRVGFITNGRLLAGALEWVLAEGVDFLAISLEGVTPQSYARTRAPARWEDLDATLGTFTARRRAHGHRRPALNVTFTLLRGHEDDLDRLPAVLDRWEAAQLTVQPLLENFFHVPGYRAVYERRHVPLAEVQERLGRLADECRRRGLAFVSPYFPTPVPDHAPACAEPFETLGIFQSGETFTCCGDLSARGNVWTEGWQAAWQSPRAAAQRAVLARGTFASGCAACWKHPRAALSGARS